MTAPTWRRCAPRPVCRSRPGTCRSATATPPPSPSPATRAEVGPAWLEPLLSWPGRLDVAVHIDPLPRRRWPRRGCDASAPGWNPPAGWTPTRAAWRPDHRRRRRRRRRPRRPDRPRRGPPVPRRALPDRPRPHPRRAAPTPSRRSGPPPRRCCWTPHPATLRHLQGWTSTLPLGHDGLADAPDPGHRRPRRAFPLASADLPAPLPGDGGTRRGRCSTASTPPATGSCWWDRWAQDNHNCVVLARSGAGKSYLVKLDVLRILYRRRPGRRHRPRGRVRPPRRRRRRHRHPARRARRPGQPPRPPAGDRRADALPAGPVPAHPGRGPARRTSHHRPSAPPWTGRSPPPTPAAGITNDPATWTGPRRCCATWPHTLDRRRRPGRPTPGRPAAPWTHRVVHGPVRRAHHHHARSGHLVVWSTAAPARRAARRRHAARPGRDLARHRRTHRHPRRTRVGARRSSSSTRPGAAPRRARAPGSCSGWPRPPANAAPA